MVSYLIRNAQILDGAQQDIHIADGLIRAIGTGLDVEADIDIDAHGLIVLPGLVDLHTHLREPGREDAETVLTGTQAAARGGFTAVHAMANTFPVADTHAAWWSRSGGSARSPATATCSRSAPSPSAWRARSSPSWARCTTRPCGVRVFSDDGKCVDDAVIMRRALEYVKAFDGVVAQHAQEPRLTEGAQMNEGQVSGELGLGGW